MDLIPKRRGIRQFIKFGLVGASSTAIDWGIYLLLTRVAAIYYLIAKILSFSVAVFNSYYWNRKWTFRSHDPEQLIQFSRFMVVALIGLGLNTLIMFLAVSKFKIHDIIALMIATVIVLFWNFLANKYYTFKQSQA